MVRIRNAGIEDVAAMTRVLASSWKSEYRGIVHDEYLDLLSDNHWVDFLIAGIKNNTIHAMVLEKEQEIIGSAILNESEQENEMNLVSFYLLPETIGRGFGHAFYTGIEIELKKKGFVKCVLDVLEHNYRAIRFYEAHGFMDTNKKIQAKLGEQEYTCNVYEKNLL